MSESISREEIQLMVEMAAQRSSDATLAKFFEINKLEPAHWLHLRMKYEEEKSRKGWATKAIITTFVTAACLFTAGHAENSVKRWIVEILKDSPLQ